MIKLIGTTGIRLAMEDFLNKRNRIVPQMIDYDKVGDRYVPYLMRFERPNKVYNSVSTDKYGFRETINKEGRIFNLDEFQNADYPLGVVVGGSTVFGVGATNNAYTIPSILNKHTKTLWYNFGGRAYNSTQELLLFLLHVPPIIKNVLVFSGVNNLTLAVMSQSTSSVYNSLFYQSQFENSFNNIGIRGSLKSLYYAIKNRLVRTNIIGDRNVEKILEETNYNNMMKCFKRDIQVLKSFCEGCHANLYFVLQPLATWIDKKLSPEESELFNILDNYGDWFFLANSLNAVKDQYFKDVENVFKELNIKYYNLNNNMRLTNENWLFVDRVHLTDHGYDLSAKIIKKEFSL